MGDGGGLGRIYGLGVDVPTDTWLDGHMNNTSARTILDRLIAQMGTSLDTADQLRKAADMLAAEFNNEVISDQVARLRTIATEYDDDADDIMSTIVDRYSPEQYEAAMS